MAARNKVVAGAVLASGILFGGLGMAALMGGPRAAEARAQADAKAAAPGRYQVASFAYGYGYSSPNSTATSSKWGAYVVDTQTGELYLSTEGGKPRPIGRVEEK